jgi:cell division protein FtsW
MPAPFISYGGSNLLMCHDRVGLLLNIAAETASPGFNDEILAAIKKKFAFLAFFRRKK